MKVMKDRVPAVVIAILVFVLSTFLTEVCSIADEAEQVIKMTAKRMNQPRHDSGEKGGPSRPGIYLARQAARVRLPGSGDPHRHPRGK